MNSDPSRDSSGFGLYAFVAALLGIGWYPALWLTSMTREFLKHDVWQHLVCLALASAIIAIWLRRFILSAETFRAHLWRATVVPYAGCLIYLCLWAAFWWTRDLLFGGLANLHDTGSLLLMGMCAALIAFPVVIPYGLLCQYVLTYLWKLE